MPATPCAEPRCPEMATRRGRCDRHAGQVETERNERRASSRRVYNSKRWRILRRRVLAESPICEGCGDEVASEVDHVRPIEDGGSAWSRSNLQSLCSTCHSSKTRAEQGAGRAYR